MSVPHLHVHVHCIPASVRAIHRSNSFSSNIEATALMAISYSRKKSFLVGLIWNIQDVINITSLVVTQAYDYEINDYTMSTRLVDENDFQKKHTIKSEIQEKVI